MSRKPPSRRNGGKAARPGAKRVAGLDLKLSAEDRILPGAGAKARSGAAGAGKGRKRSGDPSANGGGRPGHGRKAGRRASGAGRRRSRRAWWRRLRRATYWTVVLAIWGAIGLACLIGYHAAALPQMSSWAVPERPPNVRIVDRAGRLIANRGVTGGEAMRLGAMSPYLPMAVIAIEDRRFKQHFGIDPLGLARAMIANLAAGRVAQGGSTLTQQLAKNLFLEPERTVARKIQEAVLAVWLETRFSKDQILELYLNRVYFGGGAYGVDAAARRYFNKSAAQVNLAEAAMLAGLLKAPSRLSPITNPDGAEERAQSVLAAMAEEGFIAPRDAARAMAMGAETARHYWSGSQHYVADLVMDRLAARLDRVKRDIVVETTVDMDLQRLAGDIIARTIAENRAAKQVNQGAMIALAGDGAIRALVGGRDYSTSQFNRVTDARRQPGSAFKPIVYLAALEAGRTPDTIRQDRAVRIGNWQPANYDREFRGAVTLSTALAQSLNTVAAQLIMEVGPKAVVETAYRLGIRSQLQRNASIALGTSEVKLSELTAAYAPFANGGYRVEPWLIRRVTARDGTVLYSRQKPAPVRVVQPREAAMMNAMLSAVVRRGTGKAARLDGWAFAGKTGTTQNMRDALFVGYTSQMVATFWFGNDDGAPMRKVTGGSLPVASWSLFMAAAHRGLTPNELPGLAPRPVAAVPTSRPAAGREGPATATMQTGAVRRGPPRPAAELGARNAAERPRGILGRLFGARDPG